jgi:hypothetical protein
MFLRMELLRLTVGDNQGQQFELPSVLLYLNKDDECFRFIKWWSHHYSHEVLKPMWSKGESPYGEAGGDRYNDMFPHLNEAGDAIQDADLVTCVDLISGIQISPDPPHVDTDHLVPLVVIKMRVVTHLRSMEMLALGKSSLRHAPGSTREKIR